MPAPQLVLDLVDRFHQQIDAYKSGSYNETQLRREFLDPLFKALGWDVDNTSGYAEAYKDVIHEDSIKIGGFTKAPDYCFRIGGTRKFFLEAKKPSVNIKDDINPAFQLRRYAWSAKLPLSILSDFEELAAYDCRIKPVKIDKSATARTLYINYREYPQRWDEIEAVFSREAVLKGSFDKYAETGKGKKGTAEVDAAFLKEIESWRELLARSIALRNPQLTQRELNCAVQQTIDRIIFLRICEDRGIDEYNSLRAVINGAQVYPRLCELFQKADDKYNSGLFHFAKEKGRDAPDDCTLNLVIDDKPLKDIIGGLYYPDCPYEFSVFSSDILGQVYEQFLGKVIRLTDGHRAVIEDKPEVKKAGGVYYTPTYIVDYIVKNTVGTLLGQPACAPSEASVPGAAIAAKAAPTKKIPPKEASALRILDPACGSGSFLIGAYQYLLDWHRDWYVADNAQKWAGGKSPVLYQSHGSEWRLTTAERRRILLNNIYGVDIDPQAVEVTKLSLLLKVLEGESEQTLSKQLKLFQERALPDLESNIKCGNSLIGPDFYKGQTTFLDNEEALRINVFDWQAEFPAIMKSGGFDAVIGNPPYVDVKELPALIKAELSRSYKSATQRFDLYVPFVEKSLSLLSKGGLLSFILPSMFMRREYGAALRKVILENSEILQVVDFGTNQIFTGPLNYVTVIVLRNGNARTIVKVTKFNRTGLTAYDIKNVLDGYGLTGVSSFAVKHTSLSSSTEWQFLDSRESELFNRLFRDFDPLEQIVKFVSEGIHSGKDEVFFVPRETVNQLKLETPPVYPLAKGKDIHRYEDADNKIYPYCVLYPYDLLKGEVLSQNYLQSYAPNTFLYLVNSRTALKGRSYFEKSSKVWYELWCPRDPALYVTQKIVGPEIACKGEFTLVKKQLFVNNKLKAIVLKEDSPEALEYVLGLLNSTLLTYLHRQIAPPKGNNYFEVKTRIIGRLPIRTIDFTDAKDKARHDTMVELVEAMVSLNKQLVAAKTAHEKTALQRQIDATDRQIDTLVYELYGLTDDEIKIVEEGR